jgi:hypothetical protein
MRVSYREEFDSETSHIPGSKDFNNRNSKNVSKNSEV